MDRLSEVELFSLLTYTHIERYINEHREEYAAWLAEQARYNEEGGAEDERHNS